MEFKDLLTKRRSIYNLENKIDISNDELVDLLKNITLNTPSAFNSQSHRIVVLLNDNHHKLWNIVEGKLKAIVNGDFSKTKEKIDSFDSAYGTILFFNDENVTKGLQEQFKLYADNFPIWAMQSNGIVQYAVWMQLAEYNIGASLQHYNPLIDDEVAAEFNIPSNYKLVAQMPFGNIKQMADEKEFADIDVLLQVKK